MALTVKQLNMGTVTNNTYGSASSNEIYLVPTGKSTMVTNMTFVVNSGVIDEILTVFVLLSGVAVGNRVRLGYAYKMLASGEAGRYVIKDQIILKAGDRILADTSNNNAVDFVLSGVERDL